MGKWKIFDKTKEYFKILSEMLFFDERRSGERRSGLSKLPADVLTDRRCQEERRVFCPTNIMYHHYRF